jgi:chaperonin GroES
MPSGGPHTAGPEDAWNGTGMPTQRLVQPRPKRRQLMKIRPLHDRILAKRLAEKDKTAGGLFIPDKAKEKPLEALVISVGSGKVLENGKTQALTVKAGDRVLIGKYSGSEVKLDGDEHIILREDDVLAILEN